MSKLTDKIKNIARNAAKKITSKGSKSKRSLVQPSFKKTRDGSEMEVEVEYYIDLTDEEDRRISKVIDDEVKSEEEVLRIFNKRKKRENIADTIEVEVKDHLGEREKVPVEISTHGKILYDSDKKIAVVVSKKKKLNTRPVMDAQNFKSPKRNNFGKINNEAHRPASTNIPSLRTRIISADKKTKHHKTSMPSSSYPVANPDIDTGLLETKPSSFISGINTEYPLVSDLFLELTDDKLSGYLFVNSLRATLSVTEYKDMAGLIEKGIISTTPSLYVTIGSRNGDSREIELEELTALIEDPEVTAYKFSIPARRGALSFYLEYETRDPVLDYITEAVKQIDRAVKYLEGNSLISSNQMLSKSIHSAYNKARRLQGKTEQEWQKFFKMYLLEQKEEKRINSELKGYLMKVSESFRNRFSLKYDKNGLLNPTNQRVIRKKIDLTTKNFTDKNATDGMFGEEHTIEEAIQVHKTLSEFPALDRNTLIMPIKNNNDASSDEEDPYYSLDSTRTTISNLNSGASNSGRVYILKRFNRNREHGASLLKSPLWVNVEDPNISNGKYLAKAIIKSDSGIITEEYFMVIKS